MLDLALLLIAPATGGALALHLWQTRPHRIVRRGLAVGQVPVSLRRRGGMAVRREVAHG